MNNEQQPKPGPKGKAIASFCIGVISVFSLSVSLLGSEILKRIGVDVHTIMFPTVILILISGFIGPIGLILGILGLKSTKKKLAIAGIILSLPGAFLFVAWFLSAFDIINL